MKKVNQLVLLSSQGFLLYKKKKRVHKGWHHDSLLLVMGYMIFNAHSSSFMRSFYYLGMIKDLQPSVFAISISSF